MQAMFDLDHDDRRNHDLGFSVLLFELGKQITNGCRCAIKSDEHTRVED